MVEWSSNPVSQNEGHIPDVDQGFSEEENKNNSAHENDNKVPLVLQQLCAALQKMPEKSICAIPTSKTNTTIDSLQPTNTVNNNSSLSSSKVSPNNAKSLPSSKPESHKETKSIIEETTSSYQDTPISKTILGKRRRIRTRKQKHLGKRAVPSPQPRPGHARTVDTYLTVKTVMRSTDTQSIPTLPP